jgi:hypothetical protein
LSSFVSPTESNESSPSTVGPAAGLNLLAYGCECHGQVTLAAQVSAAASVPDPVTEVVPVAVANA